MFGGGGSGGPPSPPPTKQVDQAELDKQQSEAEANQRQLASKRRGLATTRLTDPVASYNNQQNSQKRGRSLLGGGEAPS